MSNIITFFSDAYKGLARESWMLSVIMLIYRSGSMVLPFLRVCLTEEFNVWVIPFLSAITSIRAEDKNIGAYMGLFGGIFSAALFLSPLLGSFIAENYGFRMLWLTISLLIVISLCGIWYTYTQKLFGGKNSEAETLKKKSKEEQE